MRVFAGDMLDNEEILRSLQQIRTDVTRMSEALATNVARAPGLPHRTRYLQLLQALGHRLLRAHADWLDHVERELAS